MQRSAAAFLMLFLPFATAATAASPSPMTPEGTMNSAPTTAAETEQELAALVAGEDAAWNKGDAAGFAARVLPDVIFTNVVGMFSVGKAPFLAQHERIFSTIYKGSTNHQQIVHIKLIRPDIAIVDTLSTVTGFQKAPPGVETVDGAIHARLEQVMVRATDGWWVASFHNVAVNPAFLSGAASHTAK